MKKKLTPIAIDKALELSEIFDKCHSRFKETIATKRSEEHTSELQSRE